MLLCEPLTQLPAPACARTRVRRCGWRTAASARCCCRATDLRPAPSSRSCTAHPPPPPPPPPPRRHALVFAPLPCGAASLAFPIPARERGVCGRADARRRAGGSGGWWRAGAARATRWPSTAPPTAPAPPSPTRCPPRRHARQAPGRRAGCSLHKRHLSVHWGLDARRGGCSLRGVRPGPARSRER